MKNILAALCAVICVGLCSCGQINEKGAEQSGEEITSSETSEENNEEGMIVSTIMEGYEELYESESQIESGSSDNLNENIKGAKDCITRWTEYMSNAEYSKAAELMTKELIEETSILQMTDGEDKTAANATFNDDSVSVTDSSDGNVYVELEITLIPEDEPDFPLLVKVTVMSDGEKYLISTFEEDDSYKNKQDTLNSNAKHIYISAANALFDLQNGGATIDDGVYHKSKDTENELIKRTNEYLENDSIRLSGEYSIAVVDGNIQNVSYTEDDNFGQYPRY